jgi:hypothetical protein
MIEQIEAEQNSLESRKLSHKNMFERIKKLLSNVIGVGNKYECGMGKISWRESSSVVVTDATKIPVMYLVEQQPTVDKRAIRSALSDGVVVPGAEMARKNNIQIT